MSGPLIPLAFEGQTVRASDESALFVAEDVCAALGISKHRDAVAKLDDDERGSLEVDTLGGRQTVAAVTGIGKTMIYRLERAGRFPRRYKPGGYASRWSEREVLDWLAQSRSTPGATPPC